MNTLSIPTSLPPQVKSLLAAYLCLPLGGKCVPCPYYLRPRYSIVLIPKFANYLGKGDPEEIIQRTLKLAKSAGFNLEAADTNEIINFMQESSLGVDCSGFAYHLLNAFDISAGGSGLNRRRLIKSPSPNPLSFIRELRYQINADYLTNSYNSVPVKNIINIRPGDLIRTRSGKHIMIILSLDNDKIIYAQSSRYFTKIKGVHLSRIHITNPKGRIEEQKWEELTPEDLPYNQHHIFPENGDDIYRLRIWM